jgi:hypothetical protein
MGRPTGLETPEPTEAKSLRNADLVEGLFLENGNRKQGGAKKGREKH